MCESQLSHELSQTHFFSVVGAYVERECRAG